MTLSVILLAAWLTVSIVHFGIPMMYFLYMRTKANGRSSALKLGGGSIEYLPSVSVLVPTYNEGRVIRKKLEDLAAVDYPKDRLDVIVVDSGSIDNTVEEAWRFFKDTNVLKGKVVEEGERKGKAAGLNVGMKHASGEMICISDAECQWDRMALRNAVAYFGDSSIGSVSGVHGVLQQTGTISGAVEGSYRSVYRMLRIGESKMHSTPIGEGEIQLFRAGQFTGFDPKIGGDDTCAALCMVEKGFRAISAPDVVFFEPTPPAWVARLRQKVRRGQHVSQAFMRHRGLLRGTSIFSRLIFPMEFFLYIVNPFLFPLFVVLTVMSAFASSTFAAIMAGGLLLVMLIPPLAKTAGTHVTNNLTMLAAFVQELRGRKQLVWDKIEENRDERATVDLHATVT